METQQFNWQAVTAIVGAIGLIGGLIAALISRTEKHLLDAINDLKKEVDELRANRDHDKERIHKIELAFAGQKTAMAEFKADLASMYVSRPEWNRSREDMVAAIAQIRSFCAKRHGEGSQG